MDVVHCEIEVESAELIGSNPKRAHLYPQNSTEGLLSSFEGQQEA